MQRPPSLDDGAADRFQLLPHRAGLDRQKGRRLGSDGPAGEAEDGDLKGSEAPKGHANKAPSYRWPWVPPRTSALAAPARR